MRKAVIENGIVTNVIEVSDVPAHQPDWARDLPDAENAGPDWTWDGKAFAPPPAPEPDRSTMALTFTQLLIGLVAEGWITEAEGEAWLGGTPPAAALALLDTLPKEDRFAARVRLTRPVTVRRLDPLVAGLALAEGRGPADLDRFFQTYGAV